MKILPITAIAVLALLACAPPPRPEIPRVADEATAVERQAALVEALRVEAVPLLQIAERGGVAICKPRLGCATLPLRRRARRPVTSSPRVEARVPEEHVGAHPQPIMHARPVAGVEDVAGAGRGPESQEE